MVLFVMCFWSRMVWTFIFIVLFFKREASYWGCDKRHFVQIKRLQFTPWEFWQVEGRIIWRI